MKNFLLSLFVFTILTFHSTNAQWIRVESLPITDFISIISKDSVIYTATLSNVIYKSSDDGKNWSTIEVGSSNVVIQKIEFIDSILFVGTNKHGIFQSKDKGTTFQNTLTLTLPITDFVKRGNDYFASSLGNGVYRYNSNNDTWEEFYSQSLPLNVAGSVTNVLNTKDYLFIASGANGVFHRLSFTDYVWKEGYYYGSVLAGLSITDAININDTIYVVNGNRVIVSSNDGDTWQEDKVGTINGVDKVIYEGNNELYLITNDFQFGTLIQKRQKSTQIGTDWSLVEEYIPNFYGFDIVEHNEKVFIASEIGVFYKSLSTSTEQTNNNTTTLQIRLDKQSQLLFVQCPKDVHSIELYNSIGELIMPQMKNNSSLYRINTPLSSGVYCVKVFFQDGTFTYQTLLSE